MAVAEAQKAENEVWMNPTQGTIFIQKMDHRGELTRSEQIDAGRRFTITAEERRLNMERAATPELCLFRNGTLQPVRLIGEDADTRELANNPNAMSETDMKTVLKGSQANFDTKVGAMHNVNTLERLLALAYDVDASVKRVERIRLRIGEVTNAARPASGPSPQVERPIFGKPVSPR